jgi:hypothetical protein
MGGYDQHMSTSLGVVMSDKPNVLKGLNQKVGGRAWSSVLWTIMDKNVAGAQDGSAPLEDSCGTG